MIWFLGRLALVMVSVCIATSSGSAKDNSLDCQGTLSSTRLIIYVDGVRNTRGYVVGNLYGPDKRRFLADNGWLAVWREPAHRRTTVLCTFLPGPGDYEVVAYHDANSNGVLDQGAFGIPREGYGFSNNVRPFLSAPSLASAQFRADEGDTILHIRLRYP